MRKLFNLSVASAFFFLGILGILGMILSAFYVKYINSTNPEEPIEISTAVKVVGVVSWALLPISLLYLLVFDVFYAWLRWNGRPLLLISNIAAILIGNIFASVIYFIYFLLKSDDERIGTNKTTG